MNHRIIIDKLDKENHHFAQLYSYNGLVFEEDNAELLDTVTNEFSGQLIQDISFKGWINLISKNE